MTVELLKAYGHLPTLELKDIPNAAVDITQYESILKDRQCGCPDFPDGELADADPDNVARNLGMVIEEAKNLILAHQRMLAATGSGSWGVCHPDLYPQNHAVKYYVDRDSFPNHYHRKATESELNGLVEANVWGSREKVFDLYNGKSVLDICLLVGVEETYRRVGNAHIATENRNEAGIRILSRRISGSTIGLGWFPDGTCGDRVEFHIDSTWDAGLEDKIDLFGHECGHTNKLPHTFSNQNAHRGVMSYRSWSHYYGYSTGESPFTVPRDPSWDQLIRQYGGEEVPINDGDGPIVPPKPPLVIGDISGILAVNGELYQMSGMKVK